MYIENPLCSGAVLPWKPMLLVPWKEIGPRDVTPGRWVGCWLCSQHGREGSEQGCDMMAFTL